MHAIMVCFQQIRLEQRFYPGKEELNYTITPEKPAVIRFRVIVNSGADLTDAQINAYSEDFAKKYK